MNADATRNGHNRGRGLAGHGIDRKKLPHAADSEASILGGILLRNDVLLSLPDLETDDFYDHRHKVVFQAIRNLEARDQPIDVVTLENEIERAGKLDAIGGVAFLGDLALRVPTADNVLAYTDIVRTHSRNRRAIMTLASALERAYDWPHDPLELVSETAGELHRIEVDHGSHSSKKRTRWTTPLIEFIGDEEPSDDDAEDWIIRDLVPRAEPFIFGGPMKGGKTWAAIDLCISMALGEDWIGSFTNTLCRPARVVGIFLEDNHRRLVKRAVELSRGRDRSLFTDAVLGANLRLSRTTIRIPDRRDQRELAAELKAFRADLVLIDNLTRVMLGDPNTTRDAAAFTRAWTEIGEESGASIGLLHHTKKPMGDQEKVDPFDNLRGSTDFGAAARNMIITTPLRLDGELMAEVRMRGNLDLRRESFALGFERWPDERWSGRHSARLIDRGNASEIKEKASSQKREQKAEKKKTEKQMEFQRRRELALAIVRKEGSVSQTRLAREVGLQSPRAVADVFASLVEARILVSAGTSGYVFADKEEPAEDRQRSLL